jgi:hypothetical protein
VEAEVETKTEVKMEAEPDTKHELLTEEGLNDPDLIVRLQDDIDENDLEKMNRRAELLKRKTVISEAIVVGNAKAEEPEKTNGDCMLAELEIKFASFEKKKFNNHGLPKW